MHTAKSFYLPSRGHELNGIAVPDLIVQRFLRRLSLNTSADGCWRLDSRTDRLGNYVRIHVGKFDGRVVAMPAHRLSYLLHHGPIAHGLDILHSCACKGCSRPTHIYAGTPAENARDREAWLLAEAMAGRPTAAAQYRSRISAWAEQRRASRRCDALAA